NPERACMVRFGRSHIRGALVPAILVASLLGIVACTQRIPADSTGAPGAAPATAPGPRTATSLNIALGMPSQATKSTSNASDYLLERDEYVLSYNRDRGGPNWVSWHVGRGDLGRVQRSNDFHPDPDLPAAWRITPNDYTGSGYDRGHVCPS